MHRDGRLEPLTAVAQALALTTVLTTAAVTWWRASRRPLAPVDVAAQARYYQALRSGLPFTIETPRKG